MEKYFQQIVAHTGRGERVASAVVVSSRGSTPQDVGARMLFFADGTTWGTVGGGCVAALYRLSSLMTFEARVTSVAEHWKSCLSLGMA